jgi:hypothetical protein
MNEIVLPTVGQRKVTMENTTNKKKIKKKIWFCLIHTYLI